MKSSVMFILLLRRSLLGRGPRVITALAAITLAATVTASLGNLQVSLGQKLEQELRAFGPNVLVTRSGADPIILVELERSARKLGLEVSPYSDARVWLVQSSTRVPVQARFFVPERARSFHPWWRVQGSWMRGDSEVMVGSSLALRLGLKPGDRLTLDGAAARDLRVVGIVTAGGDDDSTLFLSLPKAASTTVDGAEVQAPGDENRARAAAEELQSTVSGSRVHVLQRVALADTMMLHRVTMVFGLLGLIIVAASGVCVSTTLVTMVHERAQEIGLQKALGATVPQIAGLFCGESLVLGAVGTAAGYAVGVTVAKWIGSSVFGSPIEGTWRVLPWVISSAVGMTLVASIPAAARIARLDPAQSLKGSWS